MEKKLIFTVIGGDRRQVEFIYLILEEGHKVNAIGFRDFFGDRANIYTGIEEGLFNCDVLVLPVPYKNKEGNINIDSSLITISLAEIIGYIRKYKPWVVLGKADDDFENLARINEIDYLDIVGEETFSILNAIPTAEGAIQRAMERADTTIHGSNILVLGYGRIGKCLSRMLKGIGAKVTVAARKDGDLAWIVENGYKAIAVEKLSEVLPHQDIIFNSIPHLVMDKERLSMVSPHAIIIDLASYPGGVDFPEAEKIGIKASLDLGLPGKVAPRTAAKIICKVMMDSLKRKVDIV